MSYVFFITGHDSGGVCMYKSDIIRAESLRIGKRLADREAIRLGAGLDRRVNLYQIGHGAHYSLIASKFADPNGEYPPELPLRWHTEREWKTQLGHRIPIKRVEI